MAPGANFFLYQKNAEFFAAGNAVYMLTDCSGVCGGGCGGGCCG